MAKATKTIALTRKTTSALIVDSLRERLMNQEFSDSEVLRQEHLAREYNVSVSPVREALVQLEAEGLLKLVRHRGYSINTLSADDIRQLYELRAMIEVDLLAHAIPRLKESDISHAKQFHEAMGKICRRGAQTSAWTNLNWEFHTSLYKAADRRQFLSVLENLYQNINRYVHMQLKLQTSVDLARNVKEHGELLECCASRDTRKATQLLRHHIIDAGDDLAQFLQQNRPRSK